MLNSQIIIFPIFILCLIIACFFLNNFSYNTKTFDSLTRNSPLDGLRGILALSVLTHHFCCTYYWRKNGEWPRLEIELLSNLGAVSVSLFFLITGYLFITKIQKEKINWKELYISRFKRIVPLYLTITTIVIVITLISIKTPYTTKELIKWIKNWILFKGGPLNDFPSNLIISGVNWTLSYEWCFYFSLPILYSIIHKKFINKFLLLISAIFCFKIFKHTTQEMYLLFLFSYPAIIWKNKIKCYLAKYSIFLSIAIPALTIYCLFFTIAYTLQQKIILAFIFSFIANGFSFFGFLNIKSIKILGDISYSTYLTHGLVLYISFTMLNIFNFNTNLLVYYSYFPLIFLIVISLSFLSFIFIERPFLRK